jgi:hypothetical protein
MEDIMKNNTRKIKKSNATRKIDMADHGYRVKALGMPERVMKKMIRILILLVPIALVIFWFIKVVK